jgi:DivIVA domain-containing protein
MRKKHAADGGGTEWAAAPAGRIAPMDVQQKEFGVARFGGGYRMREVDEFLDQVTDALSALIAENERLAARGPASTSSAAPGAEARPPAGGEDRAAVDAFLQREKGFLQSLGGLVQEHAAGLKEMVHATRRGPAVSATVAPPEASQEPAAPAPEASQEPAVPAPEASQEPAVPAPGTIDVPADAEADVIEDGPGDGGTEIPGPDEPGSEPGSEPGTSDAEPDDPIRLDEPQPARSKRTDEGSDGSLRELFWGEE